ncbi:hypothetical protein, partial [Enterobacter asburiae]|uniref:hypothetical protein n=1 Tax=Enterobacter asburiae TaxID=61645 RepID=UPI001F40F449
ECFAVREWIGTHLSTIDVWMSVDGCATNKLFISPGMFFYHISHCFLFPCHGFLFSFNACIHSRYRVFVVNAWE